jgi:peptide deformylase
MARQMVLTPDPSLLQKATPVKKIDKKIDEYLQDMEFLLVTADDPIGVGLAAPQAGIPYRIFLMRPTEKSKIQVFINPEVLPTDEVKQKSKPKKRKKRILEGCLSIPNIWGNVTRKDTVKLSYLDEKGVQHTKTFKGFSAIIIQHEIDHLDGILFTKRVLEQGEKLYKSSKNEEGEEEFEEMKI